MIGDIESALRVVLEPSKPSANYVPGRTATILARRYCLPGKATRDQLADSLGVSRERVRQIEVRALRMLRHPSRREWMDDVGANFPRLVEAVWGGGW